MEPTAGPVWQARQHGLLTLFAGLLLFEQVPFMHIHSCESELCFQQLCNLHSVGVLSDVPDLKLARTDLHREQIQEWGV